MNRRGFLKLLSAVGASIALPVPKFVLAAPQEIIPAMPVQLGLIRALAAYDLSHDSWILRLDAFNGRDQFGVDVRVLGNPKDYLEQRAIAEEVLMNSLRHEKWMASDMILLPIPKGYVEPEWMR